jgi:tRNA(fMet)-specific endonuclease VapC
MYCFDTNIVIDIFRGDENLRRKLEFVQKMGADVSLTMLSVSELFKGAYQANRRDEALALVNDFIKNVTLLNLNEKSCDLFGMDLNFLKKKGELVPEFDLLIGCVAKAENKIFVTRNEKHFKNIPDLKIEVW